MTAVKSNIFGERENLEINRPTQQASVLSWNNTSKLLTLSPGNGERRLVVISSDPLNKLPLDGFTYLIGTYFGGGTVIYRGTSDTLLLNNLADGFYYVRIFEYNGRDTVEKYLTIEHNNNPFEIQISGSGFAQPTVQAAGIVIENIADDSLEISWTNGNGSDRLVVVKAINAVDSLPVDGVTYNAGAFGAGSQIGSGNYVVYKGSGSTTIITGLSADTVYHIRVFEFNGTPGFEDYLTDTTADNPIDVKTFTSQFQAVIDYAVSQTYDLPELYSAGGTKGLVDIDELISSRLANGSFLTQDIFYLLMLGDASLEDFATINYVTPGTYDLVLYNAPVYGVNGFKGTGTAYIDTQWRPAPDGVNYTQNDAGIIFYVTENITQNGASICGAQIAAGGNKTHIQLRQTSGVRNYNINQASSKSTSALADSSGLTQMERLGAFSIEMFLNGASVDVGATVSVSGSPDETLYLLARHNAGDTVGQLSSQWTLGVFEAGASQDGKEVDIDNIWDTYLAA